MGFRMRVRAKVRMRVRVRITVRARSRVGARVRRRCAPVVRPRSHAASPGRGGRAPGGGVDSGSWCVGGEPREGAGGYNSGRASSTEMRLEGLKTRSRCGSRKHGGEKKVGR